MLQPKEELKLSKEEQKRNEKVKKESTTDNFKDNAKKNQKLEIDSEGKAKPIIQKRKIQIAKPLSGKKTRIIGEDGSVLYELEPGSSKEKEILRKIKLQELDTNKRRQRAADVMNYQTGDEEGNPVYDDKLNAQTYKKVFFKKQNKGV